MKKFLPFFVVAVVFINSTCNINNREKDLKQSIITVIKAFYEKDSIVLNHQIKKEIGLIVLYRQGVFNQYSKINQFDFNRPVPEYFPYPEISSDLKIKFEELPTFDCDKMKWSKTGLYCDTTHIDSLLSTTAKNLKQFADVNIPESEIRNFKELESKSVRVVLCNKEGGDLVFYLTLMDKNWYLTILDRVTSDCSA